MAECVRLNILTVKFEPILPGQYFIHTQAKIGSEAPKKYFSE